VRFVRHHHFTGPTADNNVTQSCEIKYMTTANMKLTDEAS